jgi:branched-chain amino acid transport system permease protein
MNLLLQTMVDGLSLGSLYALVALGIGLIFGMLRLVNFAYGDFIAVGAYALVIPSTSAVAVMYLDPAAALMIVLMVCAVVAAVALLSDRLAFRPLRQAKPATLMVTSFAVGYVIQNFIVLLYGSRPKAIGLWSSLLTPIDIGPIRLPALQLVTVAVAAVLLVAVTFVMRRTRYGIQMRAAAEDFAMARYLGVPAGSIIGVAFAISALLAASVSLLVVTQTGVLVPNMGVNLMLFGFVAVVIGGIGSLSGAVLGGFLIGFSSALLQAYLPDGVRVFRDAFVFAMIVFVLLVRPSGLIKVKALQERV